MSDLKKRVEALLFSSGKRMKLEDITNLCKAKVEDVKQSLIKLKKEYEDKDSSLMLIEEGDFWKLTVKEQFLSVVQKIVTETELSKTVLETLAVIAFKYPILQSDLIKIRTNKAYDHMSELEEAGYISRQKHGRTKLIKLTDKFFEYFDLPRDKLRDQFKDFGSIAKAIEDKEVEIEKIKEEQKKSAEEMKQEDEKIKKAADTVDEKETPLETYESKQSEQEAKPKIIIQKEKLGSLDVVDEPSEEELEEERERIQKLKQEDEKPVEEKNDEPDQPDKDEHEKKSEGIKLTEEMEKEVDKKVERILHPKEENEDEKEEKEQ